MPTWLLTPPADTNWHAFKAGGQKLGEAILKRSIPWLQFFNRGVVNSTLALVDAPADTLIDVYEPPKPGKNPVKIGYVSFKGNKPWLDFFNSQSDGVTPVALGITTTAPLPAGMLTVAYTGIVTASGGVTPYAWSITAGVLPTGLALDPSTGAITGTPTVTGTFNFTVMVTDADGTTDSLAASITVYGPPENAEFEDDFDRTATTFGLGPNGQYWISSRGRSNANMQAQITAGGQASIGGAVASAAGGLIEYCVAVRGLFSAPSQYCSFIYKGFTGSFPRGGPGLFFSGDGDPENAGGYFVFLVPDAPTVHLGRWDGSAGGYTVAVSLNISTLAANDFFEMQVDIMPTENLINVWRNTVQIVVNFSDAALVRPGNGWPVLCNANPSGAYQIDEYRVRETR